ncbi:MAG: Phosphoenolpyruvate-protein phosphotransferase [Pseudomonadota bacterium]|jgi:phosphotransferase system enzyme I (PtsI)
MSFCVHGIPVSRGVAFGRAVLIASSRVDVAHYFIEADQINAEISRVRHARNEVMAEISKVQQQLQELPGREAHVELAALLDVHLMMLQDEQMADGVKYWIVERHYNAEWALTSHLEVVARQFDEMEDPYLRERKADLEQVVERLLRVMRGVASPVAHPPSPTRKEQFEWAGDESIEVPLILVAHDLSPADMLQFKQSVFAGFVTDVGGKTSHTAIVARSMDIPAVVGARAASTIIQQDDWIVIDGNEGVVIVDPSPIILAEYAHEQRQLEVERSRLHRLRNTPAVTLDGQAIELHVNIEQASDCAAALKVGAMGVGLFRSEFLFMGRKGQLPNEEEQYRAYCAAVTGMQGLPVTIRTIDVGADKPLNRNARHADDHLNPALGLRAIRWSLAEPAMFLTQLRAILRASAHGPVRLLIPMLTHVREIRQTLALIDKAKGQLNAKGQEYGQVAVGAMIEVPAAALMVDVFLRYFDFLSIGTNDLIQYTLAIDRVDESVAHLYDPMHPAVLELMARTIAAGHAHGKSVSVCGELAGDVSMTRLLLGLGLRSFSMHPSHLLTVKQQILRADTCKLKVLAQQTLASEDPVPLR